MVGSICFSQCLTVLGTRRCFRIGRHEFYVDPTISLQDNQGPKIARNCMAFLLLGCSTAGIRSRYLHGIENNYEISPTWMRAVGRPALVQNQARGYETVVQHGQTDYRFLRVFKKRRCRSKHLPQHENDMRAPLEKQSADIILISLMFGYLQPPTSTMNFLIRPFLRCQI
ncbi:hypothetical protein ACP275_07G034300 [Erythranthe tilingii]